MTKPFLFFVLICSLWACVGGTSSKPTTPEIESTTPETVEVIKPKEETTAPAIDTTIETIDTISKEVEKEEKKSSPPVEETKKTTTTKTTTKTTTTKTPKPAPGDWIKVTANNPYQFTIASPPENATLKRAGKNVKIPVKGTIAAASLPTFGFFIKVYNDTDKKYVARQALPISNNTSFDLSFSPKLTKGKYFWTIEDGNTNKVVYKNSFTVK